jgi:hypothetical protein
MCGVVGLAASVPAAVSAPPVRVASDLPAREKSDSVTGGEETSKCMSLRHVDIQAHVLFVVRTQSLQTVASEVMCMQ